MNNGSDAAGAWQVMSASDAGGFQGTLQLKRDGNKQTGDWSGTSGNAHPVTGTWRTGYIELSFDAESRSPPIPSSRRRFWLGGLTVTLQVAA